MKNRMISKILATSVLAFAASASQAAVVQNWDFVLDMNWDISKTVFTPSDYTPGYYTTPYGVEWLDRGRTVNTPTELSWGSNRSGAQFSHPNYLYARSGIVIEQPRVTGNIATSYEGQTPVITSANMFSHYNGEISGVSDLLTRAQMDVRVQLKLPGYGDTVVDLSKSFTVHFFETPNLGNVGCSYSYNCDNDVFAVVSGMDLTSTFTYDGVQYTLNYFETTGQVTRLSAAACQLMGFGAGSCYGFTTPEHLKTEVKFALTITTAVPEPETYAMLLAGLAMIGTVVRRRKTRN